MPGNAMNAAYLPAIAALAGSAIGGLTSFISSWLGQTVQFKMQLMVNDKMTRQELYRDFVNAGSSLYVDSLVSNEYDIGKLIALYAMVSRMRIISSPAVSEEADNVAKTVFYNYSKPNKRIDDISAMVDKRSFDPMKRFSETCRMELEMIQQSGGTTQTPTVRTVP
jgi:hypothetical protein